ncbi:MAG: hypothetical protein E6J21_04755 [Chloroflexota bacterium]|nr:MAG: hypothetical protein E6J21_04755 [Chloroflexota bacterium]
MEKDTQHESQAAGISDTNTIVIWFVPIRLLTSLAWQRVPYRISKNFCCAENQTIRLPVSSQT